MSKNDQQKLMELVKEYNLKEFLAAVVLAVNERGNELSDLGINDKAKNYTTAVDLLLEVQGSFIE